MYDHLESAAELWQVYFQSEEAVHFHVHFSHNGVHFLLLEADLGKTLSECINIAGIQVIAPWEHRADILALLN